MEKPKNPDEVELAGHDSENKNWRGILIALLVIVVICGLVIVAVVLVTPRDVDEELGEAFTLQDLFNPDFKIQKFTASWMDGKDIYTYRAPNGDILEVDVENNETKVIMEAIVFQSLNAETYTVSADLNFVLLAYDVQQVYHHSFLARYVIYDRHSKSANSRLIPFPSKVDDVWTGKKLQYAAWSAHGHSLTFVYGNNLYFQSSPYMTSMRVTGTGSVNHILNGLPDWLYEEEILRSNVAHWLSADNKYVAYIQFNDTAVPLHRFPVYGDANDIYGGISEVAYPKAGDMRPGINPTVKLYVTVTGYEKGAHSLIPPPKQLQNQDHYITLVQWRDAFHVLVAWSNRVQNKTIVTDCHIISTVCTDNLVESQHEGRGWVTVDSVQLIRRGQKYLTILSRQIGESGFWKHIASVPAKIDEEDEKIFLTYGSWDVTAIVGYSEDDSTVFFISSNGYPMQRHLFRLKLSADGKRAHSPQCMTCRTDGQCLYVSAQFSVSGRYFIQACLGPGVPQYTLNSTISDIEVVLEDNAKLRSHLAKKALPKKEFFEFETDDGETIWGQIFLPPILRKEHITLYPLLIHTYAGPETQLVTEEFKLDWSTYLCSSENVIYASIDGRGSSGRGNRFLHDVYKRLGTTEVQDQIDGAGFLNRTFHFVDKDRIAIWGWSYGGFVVSHVLGDRDDTMFRCGIAVAPVTDWRYYDTAYTERYMAMATSTDNYRGYDNANVSTKAPFFKGKGFLLIHGTADDNVHFQHSAQLMRSLTEAGILYQSQIYADKNHQLSGDRTTSHLYRTMTKFLQKECWGGGKPQEAKPVAAETNQKQKGGKS